MKAILSLVVICGLAPLSPAQSPATPAGQGVNPRPPAGNIAGYEWLDIQGDADWLSLRHQGNQIGAYQRSRGLYFPRVADGSFGAAGQLPVPLPASEKDSKVSYNGGVDQSRLSHSPRYVLSGTEVTPARVYAAIQAGADPIPDDGGNRRLYASHPSLPERRRIQSAIEQAVAQSGERDISVKVLDPKHYLLTDYGFAPNADGVTLWLVKPDGTEIWRENSWPDAATLSRGLKMRDRNVFDLPTIVDGLRGPSPDYDPKRRPAITPNLLPSLGQEGTLLLGAGAAFLLLALFKKARD